MNYKIIIETPRLILREMELTDAAFFFELNSDPLVTQYTGDGAFENMEEAVKITEYVRNQYVKNGYGRWLVILKETSEPIGWCGLKYHEDEKFVDLGYRFMQRYWGRGYATEASRPCMDYGFNVVKLDRIVGRVMKGNTASINVLTKMGMTFLKEDLCEGNDSLIYEIKKEDTK